MNKIVKKILKKKIPCCFLDRDGVLNYDTGYVSKINDFKWRPGVKKAINFLNKNNYYVIVISNQAGIAHGYFSENDLNKLTIYIKKELSKYYAHIDKFYYCFYHPNAKIKKNQKKSIFRKPDVGMLKLAFKNFNIIKKKSFFIGDRITDKLCARKVNLKFYFPEENLFKQVKNIINNSKNYR